MHTYAGVGLGLGNVVAGLFGGMGGNAMIGQSVICIKTGGCGIVLECVAGVLQVWCRCVASVVQVCSTDWESVVCIKVGGYCIVLQVCYRCVAGMLQVCCRCVAVYCIVLQVCCSILHRLGRVSSESIRVWDIFQNLLYGAGKMQVSTSVSKQI